MTKQPTPAQLELLAQRRIVAVATVGADGAPHLTATWFLYEDGALYLAIPSGSAKGRNLARNGRVAVMIDVRVAGREAGVTGIGRAELLAGADAEPVVQRLHRKYLTDDGLADPRVGPVFAAVDDLAVKLNPDRWISWDMGELDQQAFSGAIMQNGYLREIEP